jgi:nicotinamidase-related amidase
MAKNNIRSMRVAVLLIDVINHFEFPDGKQILRSALPIAPCLARLKRRAANLNIPVIYVNDNFGQWHLDARKLLAYCVRPGCGGKPFVELIKPGDDDYCILKPMHSARSIKRHSAFCCATLACPRLSSRVSRQTAAFYVRLTMRT